MLSTAQSDTFRTQFSGLLGIGRSIGVGTNCHCTILISPLHYSLKLACDLSINGRDDTVIDITRASVYRYRITFVVFLTA